MRTFLICGLMAAFAGAATPQAMVEAAKITSGAAAAASGVNKAVKSVVTEAAASLPKSAPAGAAKAPAPPAAAKKAPAVVSKPPAPKPSTADLEAVEPGMSRQDLIAKVGLPSFSITKSQDGGLVETLDYSTKEGKSAKVRLATGKVTSVDWIPDLP